MSTLAKQRRRLLHGIPATFPFCIVSIILVYDQSLSCVCCLLGACCSWQLLHRSPANKLLVFHPKLHWSSLPACRGQPPPGADAGIDFVAYGGCAFVERWQAWNMRTIWRRELKARDSMGAAFETIYEPAMSG